MVQETGNNHIDFTKSEQYTLSIRLCTDGFSFSIYNPIQDTFTSFLEEEANTSLSLTANLKNLFNAHEELKLKYKSVKVIVSNKRFTNIPIDIFDENQMADLFYYNHTKQTNETLLFNKGTESSIVNLYGVDKSAFQFLKTIFPEAKFYSQYFLLNEYFTAKSRFGNTKKMYVSFSSSHIDIYCYERGNLLMLNTFDAKQQEDRLYYIFAVWKQLYFDQQRDELFLSGTIKDKEAILKELKRYILQVSVIPKTNIDLQALLDYASN